MALDTNITSIGGSLVNTTAGVPTNILDGKVRIFSENDAGLFTGTPELASPETDHDYRLRVSNDQMLDNEILNYTAQNTGKHSYTNTTMTNAWAVGGMTTNASGITTTTTGTLFTTRAFFPILGSATVFCEQAVSFDAAPNSNTIIDFGLFLPNAANPYAPADGAHFRLTSAGMQGIINFNGTETSTGIIPASSDTPLVPWAYTLNKKNQYIISISQRSVEFWIDNEKVGEIMVPAGQGQAIASASLPWSMRHAIVGGAAGAIIKATLSYYAVSVGGPQMFSTLSTQGNRLFGSYQGMSGGTLGSLAQTGTITTGNAANLAPAVPTTTTAALGSGLGGLFWETNTAAVNTDLIIMSYQVPAATVSLPGRRLCLRGLYLASHVQTVVVGGPNVRQYFLAFGHTAVSLATAEAAGTKAPRRIHLPILQTVAAAQAVSTLLATTTNFVDFGDAPVYVNPGEFIQLCVRKIGTVETSGTYIHSITPIYGWE